MIGSITLDGRSNAHALRALVTFITLSLTFSCGGADSESPAGSNGMGALIGPQALQTLRSGEEVILLDVRSRAEYEQGHVPGALHFDVEHTWSEPAPKSLMKSVSAMGQVLSEYGMHSTSRTVIYDDGRYLNAARLFWVLECHGHLAVHVLEGGFQRWLVEDLEVSTDLTQELPSSGFKPLVQPYCLATTDQVYQAIDLENVILLDSRPREEWIGETSKSDQTGRIPTALHFPWSGSLSLRSNAIDPRDIPNEEAVDRILRDGFGEGEWLGLATLIPPSPASQAESGEDPSYIVYCNRGKQSAVSYLALRHSNIQSSVYDGSWLEWCRVKMPVDASRIGAEGDGK